MFLLKLLCFIYFFNNFFEYHHPFAPSFSTQLTNTSADPRSNKLSSSMHSYFSCKYEIMLQCDHMSHMYITHDIKVRCLHSSTWSQTLGLSLSGNCVQFLQYKYIMFGSITCVLMYIVFYYLSIWYIIFVELRLVCFPTVISWK